MANSKYTYVWVNRRGGLYKDVYFRSNSDRTKKTSIFSELAECKSTNFQALHVKSHKELFSIHHSDNCFSDTTDCSVARRVTCLILSELSLGLVPS